MKCDLDRVEHTPMLLSFMLPLLLTSVLSPVSREFIVITTLPALGVMFIAVLRAMGRIKKDKIAQSEFGAASFANFHRTPFRK